MRGGGGGMNLTGRVRGAPRMWPRLLKPTSTEGKGGYWGRTPEEKIESLGSKCMVHSEAR